MTDDFSRNLEMQVDEIEVLSSIYGDEWCVLDAASRLFCIKITDGQDPAVWKINLQIHMPDGYPLTVPPEYQINADWLRPLERITIQNKLDDIYCDNMGENLIFMWVEMLREFLQSKGDAKEYGANSNSSNKTEEPGTGNVNDNCIDDHVSQVGKLLFNKKCATFRKDQAASSKGCPDIIHGETITDRKSAFQPHMAVITQKAEINQVMSHLYENKKVASATHNMLAYRIVDDGRGLVYQGCEDDGETHAGSRMLHLLEIMNAENVMVVVSRWYGGIKLGPDRFKHINNCTRQILENNGFLREKEERKGPRSGKKTR